MTVWVFPTRFPEKNHSLNTIITHVLWYIDLPEPAAADLGLEGIIRSQIPSQIKKKKNILLQNFSFEIFSLRGGQLNLDVPT